MNTKFLIAISFLAAALAHLFIFHFVTFVFPVAPEAFKPKFFFLGPILPQDDVDQESRSGLSSRPGPASPNGFSRDRTDLQSIRYDTPAAQQDPFAVKTIRKPLASRTAKGREKVLIKSTFDLTSEEKVDSEPRPHVPEEKLNFEPYRPLRSRVP